MFNAPVLLCVFSGIFGLPSLTYAGYGFDMITPPAGYAEQLAGAGIGAGQGTWVRVRGLTDPATAKTGDTRTVAADRAGLAALRARGIRTAVFLRWEPSSWVKGVRKGGGHRLPLDLREAYERGQRLGATYGDLVDVWEIENEPDIDFVADNPETYAAFQKVIYLGIKTGCAVFQAGVNAEVKTSLVSTWSERKRGSGRVDGPGSPVMGRTQSPRGRVIMAPLALPPGPYLERLWANGLSDYTDGFNFHYYGYAEDFSGVYRQFEEAVGRLEAESGELRAKSLERRAESAGDSRLVARKPLPVFITEYGYGLLDGAARNTVDGRVRQWRWFKSVVSQVHALRPEGPMAFLVDPYYEGNLNEFGLTMVRPMRFTPADFNAKRPQPWMERNGHKVGEHYASPALAYLWDYAERHPYQPRDWSVGSSPASPLVIDFVAGSYLEQVKVSGGYALTMRTQAGKVFKGKATWVLYNFSPTAVTGQFVGAGEAPSKSGGSRLLTIEPGERREIVAEVTVSGEVWAGHGLRASFRPEEAGAGTAVFSTRLFPSRARMEPQPVADFDFPGEATRERQAELLRRAPAEGEPRLQAAGRWLATHGVRVEEGEGSWSFYIDKLPVEPLRPAMVELPLPKGFMVRSGEGFSLERRKREPEAAMSAPNLVADGQLLPRAGRAGDMMDVYFRTENGNLYQTWPRLRVTTDWENYLGWADDFTMGFFGRAALPWRFLENRPVALVIFLRPATLPAVVEVRNVRLVRMQR